MTEQSKTEKEIREYLDEYCENKELRPEHIRVTNNKLLSLVTTIDKLRVENREFLVWEQHLEKVVKKVQEAVKGTKIKEKRDL